MTVDQLIEVLQKFKSGAFVYVGGLNDGSIRSVTEVKESLVGYPDDIEEVITISFEQ